VNVAASYRLRTLFKQEPTLVWVRSQSRHVSFDLKDPPQHLEQLFSGISDNETYDSPPHCEGSVLAHIIRNNIVGVYSFIGVSKLSCFGCTALFEAVNHCLKSTVSVYLTLISVPNLIDIF